MATIFGRRSSTPESARVIARVSFHALLVVLGMLTAGLSPVSRLGAQAAKPPATKTDSAKTKTTTTKAPAKPTTAPKPSTTSSKPSTTTTKPSTTSTKPSTTSTKPSTTAAPAKATTDAKATESKAADAKAAPARTSAPASSSSRAATANTTASRPAAGGDRRDLVEAYSKVGLYAGGASAGLGFGTGPSAGLVWRLKSASLPLVFRADLSGSRFSQQPQTAGGAIAGDATLLHLGGSLGFEWVPGATRSVRPYVTVSGGIYRFQGEGPAGTNGDIVNGVFATTNDVALLAGAGVRLGQRVFLEARMVTVGDFQSIPVVIGVHF